MSWLGAGWSRELDGVDGGTASPVPQVVVGSAAECSVGSMGWVGECGCGGDGSGWGERCWM